MGSLAPPASASLLLPPLSPAVDNWFISSTSDHLLTQALTRELSSTCASSSSSGPTSIMEPFSTDAQSKLHSYGFLLPHAQSSLSQLGSPLSSDSVSKEYQPESPFNYTNSSRMSKIAISRSEAIAETCRYKKAGSPLQASSIALSSQAAVGAGASKVSKARRSRTNKKAPIAVLSADTSNFRAMVQQLTGIPTPQAFPLPHIWGDPSLPLLHPQPTRNDPLELPTLDTSSSFLAPKINSFLQGGHQALSGLIAASDLISPLQGKRKPFLGSSYHPNMIDYEALLSSSSSSAAAAALASPWDLLANANLNGNLKYPSAGKEGENCAARPSPTSLESFLMLDDDQYPKVSYNTVDSWLAFDGGSIANHSPKLDFTKIAS